MSDTSAKRRIWRGRAAPNPVPSRRRWGVATLTRVSFSLVAGATAIWVVSTFTGISPFWKNSEHHELRALIVIDSESKVGAMLDAGELSIGVSLLSRLQAIPPWGWSWMNRESQPQPDEPSGQLGIAFEFLDPRNLETFYDFNASDSKVKVGDKLTFTFTYNSELPVIKSISGGPIGLEWRRVRDYDNVYSISVPIPTRVPLAGVVTHALYLDVALEHPLNAAVGFARLIGRSKSPFVGHLVRQAQTTTFWLVSGAFIQR